MDRSFSRLALRVSSLALVSLLYPLSALGAPSYDDGEDLLGFDSIVTELTKENRAESAASLRSKAARSRAPSDPFDSILIHFGIGFTGTMQNMRVNETDRIDFNENGFQAQLGIDLFSENWMAEGTARSFGDSDDSAIKASLKEFELKIFYRNRFSRQLGMRAGAGLTARYLTLQHATLGTIEYTTPSSVGTLGLDFFMTDGFSIGADVSARNTMIAETIDRNSFDATLRLDTHF